MLPTITQPLTGAPTATGTPKPCVGVAMATESLSESPTNSAIDFNSNSICAVFLFVVIMLID